MWGSLDCAQAIWNAAVMSTKPWFLLSNSEINIVLAYVSVDELGFSLTGLAHPQIQQRLCHP